MKKRNLIGEDNAFLKKGATFALTGGVLVTLSPVAMADENVSVASTDTVIVEDNSPTTSPDDVVITPTEPVVDTPVIEPDPIDEPVITEPVTDEPVIDVPVVTEPETTETPVVDEPVATEPTETETPTTDSPVVTEPVVTEQPTTTPTVKPTPAVNVPKPYTNGGGSAVVLNPQPSAVVTTEPSVEAPVITGQGYKIVSTTNSLVKVENADGTQVDVKAEEIGGVTNEDGTVTVKTADGKLETLPQTGVVESMFLTLIGFLLLIFGFTIANKRRQTETSYL